MSQDQEPKPLPESPEPVVESPNEPEAPLNMPPDEPAQEGGEGDGLDDDGGGGRPPDPPGKP